MLQIIRSFYEKDNLNHYRLPLTDIILVRLLVTTEQHEYTKIVKTLGLQKRKII